MPDSERPGAGDQAGPGEQRCDGCGGSDITYQMFSGGREYYCRACDDRFLYDSGAAPRRIQMIADGQMADLRKEMRDELARLSAPPAATCSHSEHEYLPGRPVRMGFVRDERGWARWERCPAPAATEAVRVTDGVIALYRPGPVRNPWHCYNTRTGEFIECRTDDQVASYHAIPPNPVRVPERAEATPADRRAASLARLFHATYERLAPRFGYRTREASAKPWAEVPEENRALMTAVCAELLTGAAAARLVPLVADPPAPVVVDADRPPAEVSKGDLIGGAYEAAMERRQAQRERIGAALGIEIRGLSLDDLIERALTPAPVDADRLDRAARAARAAYPNADDRRWEDLSRNSRARWRQVARAVAAELGAPVSDTEAEG